MAKAKQENTINHSGGPEKNSNSSLSAFKEALPETSDSLRHKENINKSQAEIHALEADMKLMDAKEQHAERLAKHRDKMRELGLLEEKDIITEAVKAGNPEKKNVEEVQNELKADTQVVVEQTIDDSLKVAENLAKDGKITPEQLKIIQYEVKSQEKKNFIKSALDSGFRGTATGLAASIVAKSAVRAGAVGIFGASLGTMLTAGAVAGGAVEAGRAMWRESRKFENKENIDKLEKEEDFLKKAAILNKLEEAYGNGKLKGSPEELQMAADVLHRARTHMEAVLHSKDTKYEGESDRDKLAFLLKVSDSNRKSLSWSHKRQANKLIKEADKGLSSERNFANLKGRWGKVGWATLKGASFGLLGAGVGYAVTSTGVGRGIADGVKSYFGYVPTEHGKAIVEISKTLKPNIDSANFSEHIGSKGVTGAYREMVRDYIIERMAVDPHFADNINIENLVFAEDFLKDRALEQGLGGTQGVLKASGAELNRALTESMKLDDKDVKHIAKLISGNKHLISAAVRQHMLDWRPGMLSNPDNDILKNVVDTARNNIIATGSVSSNEAIFAGSRFYEDIATVMIVNSLVEEGLMHSGNASNQDQVRGSGKEKDNQGNEKPDADRQKPEKSGEEVVGDSSQAISTSPKLNPEGAVADKDPENREKRNAIFSQLQAKLNKNGVKATIPNHVINSKFVIENKDTINSIIDIFIDEYKKQPDKTGMESMVIQFVENEGKVETKPNAKYAVAFKIPLKNKLNSYKKEFRSIFNLHPETGDSNENLKDSEAKLQLKLENEIKNSQELVEFGAELREYLRSNSDLKAIKGADVKFSAGIKEEIANGVNLHKNKIIEISKILKNNPSLFKRNNVVIDSGHGEVRIENGEIIIPYKKDFSVIESEIAKLISNIDKEPQKKFEKDRLIKEYSKSLINKHKYLKKVYITDRAGSKKNNLRNEESAKQVFDKLDSLFNFLEERDWLPNEQIEASLNGIQLCIPNDNSEKVLPGVLTIKIPFDFETEKQKNAQANIVMRGMDRIVDQSNSNK